MLSSQLPRPSSPDSSAPRASAALRATAADVIVIGTPIDLTRLIEFDKPSVRVRYELQEIGDPTLEDALKPVL